MMKWNEISNQKSFKKSNKNKNKNKNKIKHVLMSCSLALSLMATPPEIIFAQEKVTLKNKQWTATEVFKEMSIQEMTHDGKAIKIPHGVKANNGLISFGAEKEGTGAKIAYVMSPTSKGFKKFIYSLDHFYRLDKENRTLFLKTFLKGLQDGSIRQEVVADLNGVPKIIDYSFLSGQDIEKFDRKELQNLLDQWLAQVEDKPFSFLKPEVKREIMEGKLPGNNPSKARWVLGGTYRSWTPQFGLPQKYIISSEPAADYIHRKNGFELGFKPHHSYGEYEEFVAWLKRELRDDPNVPEKGLAPGQQRVVWANMKLPLEERVAMNRKTGNLYKVLQAYVVLRGIRGQTGIITAKWKKIQSDKELYTLKTGKGVLRAEHGRWANTKTSFFNKKWKGKTGAVEFRSGTKDTKVARLLTKAISSRMVSNDWSGMNGIEEKWKLVPESLLPLSKRSYFFYRKKAAQQLAQRFHFPVDQLVQLLDRVRNLRGETKDGISRRFQPSYLVPLWHWERAPFLSEKKREIIYDMSNDFIHHLIKKGDQLTFEDLELGMQEWVKVTNIDQDLEDYVTPKDLAMNEDERDKSSVSETISEPNSESDPFIYQHPLNGTVKDINAIDVGIEFTAKMPIKDMALYFKDGRVVAQLAGEAAENPENPVEASKKKKAVWLQPRLGMVPNERENLIFNVAKALHKALNLPSSVNIVDDQGHTDGAHGHNVNISYRFSDPKHPLGQWRVEWDGIVREYDAQGKIIPGSTRGGVIELVTPRFTPNLREVEAVFKAFRENSAIPNVENGGGHINVDSDAFRGNPQAMARFLTLFHKYRGTISLMFQHPKRLKSAEPAEVSPDFQHYLQHFNGVGAKGEEQLKQELYRQQYFNRRVGRKTRYLQIDLSNYFQDVIPEEFITKDFDIKAPQILWRQQFRVRPDMRKMEFRLMDAPRSARDSAAQLTLVRALLNRAFNDSAPVEGDVQAIDYLKYVDNPRLAFNELDHMCEELGLKASDYKGYMGEGLNRVEVYMESPQYKSFEDMVKPHAVVKNWGEPVAERPREEGLYFDQRDWMLPDGQTKTTIVMESLRMRMERMEEVRENDEIRAKHGKGNNRRNDVANRSASKTTGNRVDALKNLFQNTQEQSDSDDEHCFKRNALKYLQEDNVEDSAGLKPLLDVQDKMSEH